MKVKHFLEKSNLTQIHYRYREIKKSKWKLIGFEGNEDILRNATIERIIYDEGIITIYCYERKKRCDHGKLRRR